MKVTNGFIESGDTKEFLTTYSEEERQEMEIAKSNSSLIFSPKFVPIYPELLEMGLTLTEAMIFGFIDFYKSSSSNRFYFTNEQISQIVHCNPDSVSRAITKIERMGLIKTSRKMRAGGGLIRFVTDIFYNSKLIKTQLADSEKLQTNNNKIKENKINNNKRGVTPQDIEDLSKSLKVSPQVINKCIESIHDYEESVGKKYKSIKHTVRRWVNSDIDKGKLHRLNPVILPPQDFRREGLDKMADIRRKVGL